MWGNRIWTRLYQYVSTVQVIHVQSYVNIISETICDTFRLAFMWSHVCYGTTIYVWIHRWQNHITDIWLFIYDRSYDHPYDRSYMIIHIWSFIYDHPYMNNHMSVFIFKNTNSPRGWFSWFKFLCDPKIKMLVSVFMLVTHFGRLEHLVSLHLLTDWNTLFHCIFDRFKHLVWLHFWQV